MKITSQKQLTEKKNQIRRQAQETNNSGVIKIIFGFTTTDIALGAEENIKKTKEFIEKYKLNNVLVDIAGDLDFDNLKPIIKIYGPEGNETIYCQIGPNQIEYLLKKHLIDQEIVSQFVLDPVQRGS